MSMAALAELRESPVGQSFVKMTNCGGFHRIDEIFRASIGSETIAKMGMCRADKKLAAAVPLNSR